MGLVSYGALLQGGDSLAVEAECALHELAQRPPGELEAGLQAHLRRFGHLVYQLDIAEPTPAEQSDVLRASVAAYRTGRASDPRERQQLLRQRSRVVRDAADRALRRSPLRRRALSVALAWTRHWSAVRDEALHAFTLPWPLLRRGYLELGRRLVEERVLASREDVFYLTVDELHRWCESPGDADTGRWTHAIRRRRDERERRRHLTPPPDIVHADARVVLGPWDITSLALFGRVEGTGSGSELRGVGVSSGRVRGRVRIPLSVHDTGDLSSDDILVVPHLTPAWSSVLTRVGAVVTDVGGSLSHGSIVARELGVPAVMGTRIATKVLEEGQLVDVDGAAGTVLRRNDPDAGRAPRR